MGTLSSPGAAGLAEGAVALGGLSGPLAACGLTEGEAAWDVTLHRRCHGADHVRDLVSALRRLRK